MAKSMISTDMRDAVMIRANRCYEYCRSQDKYSPAFFTIDHIIPQSLDGVSDSDNLAYACFTCNRLKSNKQKVFDTLSDKWIALFNPRQDVWTTHFVWNEDTSKIIGITTIRRATVTALKLNREKLIEYRNCLILFGAHPPPKA